MDAQDQRDWERDYDQLLQDGMHGGRVHMQPSNSEKRRHPRFKVDDGRLYVTEQVPYPIVDLSKSGLAFYAGKAFPVGGTIQVSLRGLIAIESVVLGSDPLTEPDAPAAYRIRCRFADSEYGLRFLLLALELEGRQAGPDASGSGEQPPGA